MSGGRHRAPPPRRPVARRRLPLNGLFSARSRRAAIDHGCHVVAPDASGFGGSPALDLDRYRPSAIAALAVALADALGLGGLPRRRPLLGRDRRLSRLRALPRAGALAYAPGRRLPAAAPEWFDAAATLEPAREWAADFRFASWEAARNVRDPDTRR